MSERWERFDGKIVEENEEGAKLIATDSAGGVVQMRRGYYRKNGNGDVEVRLDVEVEGVAMVIKQPDTPKT